MRRYTRARTLDPAGYHPGEPDPGVVLRRCPVADGDPPAGVTVARCCAPPRQHRPTEPTRHDDVAFVMPPPVRADRRSHQTPLRCHGLVEPARPRPRAVSAPPPDPLLLIPLVTGLLGAPSASPSVSGRRAVGREGEAGGAQERVAEQKAQIAAINDLQQGLAAEISEHQDRAAQDRRRPRRGPQEDLADADAHRQGEGGLRGPRRPAQGDGRRTHQVEAQEEAKRLELAAVVRSWPTACAAPTTPTARRRSRRSCPAGRSPTCSPR